jgi:hypothetical protein
MIVQPLPVSPAPVETADTWLRPERGAEDMLWLERLWARLRSVPTPEQGMPTEPRPLVLSLHEPDGRAHRIVLSRFERLLQGGDFTFVGFFGLRSPERPAYQKRLDELDAGLLAEFGRNAALLTYNSVEVVAGGNWANLVLFESPGGIDAWREGALHQRVVSELAPHVYSAIRLHTGTLVGGLADDARFRLKVTKYYDYSVSARR